MVTQVLATGERLKKDYDKISKSAKVGFEAENFRRLVDHREVWPYLCHDAADALASTNPQPELLGADVEKILAIAPEKRRLVELVRLDGKYTYLADQGSRRIDVTMHVRLSHDRANKFLNGSVAQWLRDNAERPGVPYRVLTETISCNPGDMQTILVTETGEQEKATGKPPKRSSGAGAFGGGSAPGRGRTSSSTRP